jgi:hypothetical protein
MDEKVRELIKKAHVSTTCLHSMAKPGGIFNEDVYRHAVRLLESTAHQLGTLLGQEQPSPTPPDAVFIGEAEIRPIKPR